MTDKAAMLARLKSPDKELIIAWVKATSGFNLCGRSPREKCVLENDACGCAAEARLGMAAIAFALEED